MDTTLSKSSRSGEVPGGCLSDDLIFRYTEGKATKAEAQSVYQHLNSCETCFAIVATLAKTPVNLHSEPDFVEFEKAVTLHPEQQFARILSYVHPQGLQTDQVQSNALGVTEKLWQGIKDTARSMGVAIEAYSKPAIALAATIIVSFIIGRPYYYAWRSNDLAKGALAYLAENHSITSRDELRPAGGFRYDEFGPTRGGESKSIYYEPAKASLEKALQLNGKNSSAHHYLGTYYLLIERNLSQAKEHYVLALAQDSANAAILNDLGIVAFHNGAYDEAAEKFSMALKRNPQLLEAHYNLATLYQKQGKGEDALKEWEKYLQLDPTFNWAEVARNRLKLLQKDQ